jgi:hypothetical protein
MGMRPPAIATSHRQKSLRDTVIPKEGGGMSRKQGPLRGCDRPRLPPATDMTTFAMLIPEKEVAA